MKGQKIENAPADETEQIVPNKTPNVSTHSFGDLRPYLFRNNPLGDPPFGGYVRWTAMALEDYIVILILLSVDVSGGDRFSIGLKYLYFSYSEDLDTRCELTLDGTKLMRVCISVKLMFIILWTPSERRKSFLELQTCASANEFRYKRHTE